MIIVNGFQPLTIITKSSILDVAAVLDRPLRLVMAHQNKFDSVLNNTNSEQTVLKKKVLNVFEKIDAPVDL